jgi:outer membrane protein OmpA-like peptidoglycan-associated protein
MTVRASNLFKLSVAIFMALVVSASMVMAQSFANQRSEQYYPTTWVDPDGCEHWVMDDGAEGFITPKTTPDGRPVCNGGPVAPQPMQTCGRLTDQYFRTDSYSISPSGVARLQQFFTQNRGQAFILVGHTDSRASNAYNDRLSVNRARSVAQVAQSVGARVVEVRGMGENQPIASNATAEGRAQNRRVDIQCVNAAGYGQTTYTQPTYVAPAPTYVAPAPVYVEPTPVHVDPVPAPAPAPTFTGKVCGRLGNQYFATDRYDISAEGRANLTAFFQQNPDQRFAIVGHTDSRASDAYNIRLSQNRANAVAQVARAVGANIVDVRGMGERQPIATNSTVIGMAQNRRVDIICVN